MELFLLTFTLCATFPIRVGASPGQLRQGHAWDDFPITRSPIELSPRQNLGPDVFTCGYGNGDLSKSRLAPSGFKCSADVTYSYWGFCPTSRGSLTNCPLYGCVDPHSCTSGCGSMSINKGILSCSEEKPYCNSDLLTGQDFTYTFLYCGSAPFTGTMSAASEFVAQIAAATSAMGSTGLTGTASPTASLSSPGSSATVPTVTSTASPGGSPAATPATTPSNEQPKSSSSDTGAIVGGVVGGLAVLSTAAVGFFFIRRKYQRRPKEEDQKDLPGYSSDYSPSAQKYAEFEQQQSISTELYSPPGISEMGPKDPVELSGEERKSTPEQKS